MLNEKGKALLRLCIILMIQFILVMLKITQAVNWGWEIILIPIFVTVLWELLWIIIYLFYLNRK